MKTTITPSLTCSTTDAFVAMYSNDVYKPPYRNCVVKCRVHRKTLVLVSGKREHESFLLNLLGKGMADCYVEENEVEETAVNWICEAIETANTDTNVIWIHSAWMSNRAVSLIKKVAQLDGINLVDVVYGDPISNEQDEIREVYSEPVDAFFVIKEIGAAADRNVSWEDIVQIAERVKRNSQSVYVELHRDSTECNTKKYISAEIRNGSRCNSYPKLSMTELTINILEEACNNDVVVQGGDRVVVDLRSCGEITPIEISDLICEINYSLKEMGINVHCFTNKRGYATGTGIGIIVSIIKLDDELQELWDDDASSPGYSSITF